MNSCSEASSSSLPKVVIRRGHIIPSIRLTPPDSRPAMAPSVPEQDLGSCTLFVPLRTEEVGWEEGGLIWAAKRYFYPTVNLYGGSDDHVIGTYRGGPKGYRFVNITDKNFALESNCELEASQKESKTSSNGSKSALPKGPATKLNSSEATSIESSIETGEETQMKPVKEVISKTEEARSRSFSSSSSPSTPSSSRRGSNSTEDDDNSSGADTGLTTPTSEFSCKGGKQHSDRDMADELEAALFALQQDEEQDVQREPKKTRLLASRAGAGEICSDPVDASRLAGPMKSQLYSNGLGLDRSLTLSDSIPSSHFQEARGRSRSRRSMEAEYSAGWSYEQNMEQQLFQ